jgi:hypothetical protein
MRNVFIPIAAALVACGSYDQASVDAPRGSDATVEYTSTTDPPTAPATPDSYSLHGTIVVVDGSIDLAETALSIDTYIEGSAAEACAGALTITASATEAIPNGEPIDSWWSIQLAPPPECEDAANLLSHLGLGAYDARLDVGLAAHGLSDATAYGLYTQAEGEPLWLVGVGGTEDQLAGLASPDPAAPVPDGRYEVQALVLTPWPSP